MIGVNLNADPAVYSSPAGDVCARYFDGVGLGGDFLSYVWNGALATDAKRECSDVYNFVAENFTWNARVHTEVWLFGISRGAFIVRSVGGMINNCGIIQDTTNRFLMDQLYDIYQSPLGVHHPSSPEMVRFRADVSHAVRTPVKFMGLFDTVGARGVPKLNYHTGTGFEWPGLHDNKVSTAVEKVYHALAMHDRFWAFQPCLAERNSRHANDPALNDLKIRQTWFPGCHYDLARQEFQFLRESGSFLETVLFPILNLFSDTVHPNEKLSDLVLLWMLQGIDDEGGGSIICQDTTGNPSDIGTEVTGIQTFITRQSNGSGDIYGSILRYIPGGKLFSAPVAWWKNLNRTAYAILFEPVDRRIPDPGAENGSTAPVWNQVYHYVNADPNIGGNVVGRIAGVRSPRYPSQTYQNYLAYMAAVRRQN